LSCIREDIVQRETVFSKMIFFDLPKADELDWLKLISQTL